MNQLKGFLEVEKLTGHTYTNHSLLCQALTHSSYTNESKNVYYEDYERLEFLGDAVLELTTSEFLYMNHPDMREGNMTKMRASLVCEATLASCARKIGLEQYILFGKGEEQTGGRNRDSIISDVLEAVIGSLYLDGGIEAAKHFIHQCVLDHYEDKILFYDSKTILQEWVQEKGKQLSYELIAESGPAHNRIYKVNCLINKKKISEGSGRTKKGAEQEAAYKALIILNEK